MIPYKIMYKQNFIIKFALFFTSYAAVIAVYTKTILLLWKR